MNLTRPIQAHPITQIDWDRMQKDLGTREFDPEGIVHELVHTIRCIGKDAYQDVGIQATVADRLRATFKTNRGRDNEEVKASVLTFLVLQPLGYADLDDIIRGMAGNMSLDFFHRHQEGRLAAAYLLFTESMQGEKGKKLKGKANRIREEIMKRWVK